MPRIKKTWKAGVLQTFDWHCRFFLSPDPTGNIWDKFKTPQKASSNCGFVIIYCLFASGSRRFFFCLCMGDFLQSGIALLALPHPDGNWSFVSQKNITVSAKVFFASSWSKFEGFLLQHWQFLSKSVCKLNFR